jgi:hypothetical protein
MKRGADSRYLGPPPLPFGHPDCVGDGLQPEIPGVPGGAICSLVSDHARATTSRAFRPLNNTHRDGKYSCRHPGSVIVVDYFTHAGCERRAAPSTRHSTNAPILAQGFVLRQIDGRSEARPPPPQEGQLSRCDPLRNSSISERLSKKTRIRRAQVPSYAAQEGTSGDQVGLEG